MFSLKQDINLGAYGWHHQHWLNTFYPEDLPEGWQLAYYSNEFNTVVVPADYWQTGEVLDCEDWLDNVHDGFQFIVECHADMFNHISLPELTGYLKVLQPQLSALVFLEDKQQMPESVKKQFNTLIDSLEVAVFGSGSQLNLQAKNIWRPGRSQEKSLSTSFSLIENDLSDLRAARTMVEDFVNQLENDEQQTTEASIIVNHPKLQASDLSKFRSLLEIMGF